METLVKVMKWGRDMAVLLPGDFVIANGIHVGTTIDIDGIRIVRPQRHRRRRYTASELMARFRPEHRQGEWNLGRAVGRETW